MAPEPVEWLKIDGSLAGRIRRTPEGWLFEPKLAFLPKGQVHASREALVAAIEACYPPHARASLRRQEAAMERIRTAVRIAGDLAKGNGRG